MTYDPEHFNELLNSYGELHVTLASGNEYHLHKHDVTVTPGLVIIDSKLGDWEFKLSEIEDIEKPHSHKE